MKYITDLAAIKAAKNLSRNIFHEDDFYPSTLRVFLNNLPKVSFVHFNLRKQDDFYVFPSCSVQINFVESKFRPILIIMASPWQFETYWVEYRSVPVRYVIDGHIDPLPF